MAEVFLSYASEDRDRVRPLAEALMARGFDIWWDRALASGDDFGAVIQRELGKAKAVIVVWTRTSVASVWVRDEAGRARDDGRLLPVMLDRVQLPLGFGAFQAEDFSSWNGSSSAAQMQLLEEALKAKLEGRGVDSAAVAARRRRLMNRIRIGSVLMVTGSVVAIAANITPILRKVPGLSDFIPGGPEIVQQDRTALLLELVRDGKITPEQAIELARLLESQAFAQAPTTQEARLQQTSAEPPETASPSPSAPGNQEDAPSAAPFVEPAAAEVTASEFDAAARETARQGFAELVAHPDPVVRNAAVQLRNPATLDQGMQTLWAYAAAHPGPTQATIYRVCGAVGEANNHPLGVQALERARNLNPQNSDTWRMLSFGLRRENKTAEAQASALVGDGLQAETDGRSQVAEQRLQQALPNLQSAEGRAFVEGRLGDVAAKRQDWDTAARRYESAFRVREQQQARASGASGAPPRAATINVDAQKLVRALDRSGRTNEACEAVERAQKAGVDDPDVEVSQRCVRLQLIRPRAAQTTPQLRQRTAIERTTVQRTN
jgi:tetratricopeptide (TPR) repeat protein